MNLQMCRISRDFISSLAKHLHPRHVPSQGKCFNMRVLSAQLSTFHKVNGGGGLVKCPCPDKLDISPVNSGSDLVMCGRRSAAFHSSSVNFHGEFEWQDPKTEEEIVQVHFIDKEGKPVTIRGKVGDNLLYLSKRFEVEMEGACEASLACTTCHVYVDHDFLDLLPEATETEEDLLDQAPFLKENSRLGCQIILNKELDGIKLALPAATKNFYVDGHKPTPH